MDLSEKILGLHTGIRTVLVTRQDAGEWRTINEAIRPGIKLLEETREQARAMLAVAPGVILGAAETIGGRAGNPEIVAILYQKVGVVFASIDPTFERIICVTTEREALEEVVRALRNSLMQVAKDSGSQS